MSIGPQEVVHGIALWGGIGYIGWFVWFKPMLGWIERWIGERT